jgi:hypothetical protein
MIYPQSHLHYSIWVLFQSSALHSGGMPFQHDIIPA